MEWRTHIGRHGSRMLPGKAWERWTLFILLVLAAVLRFWRLPEIPYTHDEISGLLRTGYDTFGQLIRDGVAIDAHPPATAVFLHYWTMLGGYGEGWVKAPFILLSVVALFLLYRFALAWTNSTVALFSVALLATLQYTVMYAQIARPYALGFFTCALLADQWTRWLASGPGAQRALVGTVVGFVLCAYTHHFSLLFAGLVGLTGLVLAAPAQRRAYLIAACIAVLLYLPNVPIFLQQLSYGGVGQWLAPPDRRWVPDYLAWVMQYCWSMAFLLGGLVLLSLLFRSLKGTGQGPILRIAGFWGTAPLVIGFLYSLWVDPVLQYSTLLFSFPFLLIGLLHGLPEAGPRATVLGVVVLAALGVDGLVRERRHYVAFYGSKYEAMLHAGINEIGASGMDGTLVVLDAPADALGFHLREWGAELPYVDARDPDLNNARLDSVLRAARGRVVVYGASNGASPELVARIQTYFPVLLSRRDLAEGQVFRFADKQTEVALTDRRELLRADPSTGAQPVFFVPDDLPVDSSGNWDYNGREYGAHIQFQLDSIVQHVQDRVEIQADLIVPDGTHNVGLVLELKREGETVFYRTDELERAAVIDGKATLVVACQPGDAGWRKGPLQLRAYLHNRNGAPLGVVRFKAFLRSGDHWQYAFFRNIPRAPLYP